MRQRLVVIGNGIPTGMMLGAKVTLADWWLWNQGLGGARQYRRRLRLHRACHLRNIQARFGIECCAATNADAGSCRMTSEA